MVTHPNLATPATIKSRDFPGVARIIRRRTELVPFRWDRQRVSGETRLQPLSRTEYDRMHADELSWKNLHSKSTKLGGKVNPINTLRTAGTENGHIPRVPADNCENPYSICRYL